MNILRRYHSPKRRTAGSKNRHGTATVEFAMTASLVFTIFFALLEIAIANSVRATAEVAAIEGSRRGIVPGSTTGAMQAAAERELNVLGLSGCTVNASITAVTPTTDNCTCTVTVPLHANYPFMRAVMPVNITRTITLQRHDL